MTGLFSSAYYCKFTCKTLLQDRPAFLTGILILNAQSVVNNLTIYSATVHTK